MKEQKKYNISNISPRITFWLLFLATVILFGIIFAFSNNSHSLNNPASIESPKPESVSILFGGDIFLDRSIRRTIEKTSIEYPWQPIAEFLKSYEYKVANLEGPVWNKPIAAPSGSFSFAFQEDYVRYLGDGGLGFTALSLANNHTDNEGQKALNNTRHFLLSIGILPFGDPNNANVDQLGWVEIYPGSDPEGNFTPIPPVAVVGEHNLYSGDPANILNLIPDLKERGYFVIVMPHWGPEYDTSIPAIERRRAEALIDVGADLIIGSHPHVVQPSEVYKGKTIYYSLGNFLFDQGFSKETMQGLLVEVVFQEGKEYPEFVEYQTEQDNTFQINLKNGSN